MGASRREFFTGMSATVADAVFKKTVRYDSIFPAAPEGSEVQEYTVPPREKILGDGPLLDLRAFAETDGKRLIKNFGFRHMAKIGTGRMRFHYDDTAKQPGVLQRYTLISAKEDTVLAYVNEDHPSYLEIITMNTEALVALDAGIFIVVHALVTS